jgi:hypothetical protein
LKEEVGLELQRNGNKDMATQFTVLVVAFVKTRYWRNNKVGFQVLSVCLKF